MQASSAMEPCDGTGKTLKTFTVSWAFTACICLTGMLWQQLVLMAGCITDKHSIMNSNLSVLLMCGATCRWHIIFNNHHCHSTVRPIGYNKGMMTFYPLGASQSIQLSFIKKSCESLTRLTSNILTIVFQRLSRSLLSHTRSVSNTHLTCYWLIFGEVQRRKMKISTLSSLERPMTFTGINE